MVSCLIIDGYNLINKWPLLIKAKHKNFELARSRLLGLIQHYCDFTGIKGIIVYDGKGSKRSAHKGNPMVIFSRKNESADTVIESFVYKIEDKKTIRLVTDDRVMANLVSGMGALVTSTKIFEMEMKSALSSMREIIMGL